MDGDERDPDQEVYRDIQTLRQLIDERALFERGSPEWAEYDRREDALARTIYERASASSEDTD